MDAKKEELKSAVQTATQNSTNWYNDLYRVLLMENFNNDEFKLLFEQLKKDAQRDWEKIENLLK